MAQAPTGSAAVKAEWDPNGVFRTHQDLQTKADRK